MIQTQTRSSSLRLGLTGHGPPSRASTSSCAVCAALWDPPRRPGALSAGARLAGALPGVALGAGVPGRSSNQRPVLTGHCQPSPASIAKHFAMRRARGPMGLTGAFWSPPRWHFPSWSSESPGSCSRSRRLGHGCPGVGTALQVSSLARLATASSVL
jgi:hypothetical protein